MGDPTFAITAVTINAITMISCSIKAAMGTLEEGLIMSLIPALITLNILLCYCHHRRNSK